MLGIKEGVIQVFRSKVFLFHSAEKFRRGSLLYFTKIMVSKNFLEKRWEYLEFPSIVFCLTVQKNIVGEDFFVSQNFWYQKNLGRRGRGVSGVSIGISLSHFAEKFRREPISVSLLLGIDKFYNSEGCVTILCPRFVVSQCQNFSKETLLFFH